jgi:quinol monooxygenase YgiN
MIIVTIKATPILSFKQEYINQFRKIAEVVRKENGCLEYEIYQKEADTPELFIFERWSSKEALDAHLQSEHMIHFFSHTSSWFAKNKEMDIYQL